MDEIDEINGFDISYDKNKVLAHSDDDVNIIKRIFPIGTIISTQHNYSQMSENFYSKPYYIVGKNQTVEGFDYLMPEDESKGEEVLNKISNEDGSRGRSSEERRHTRRRRRSRSRSSDSSHRRGGKRKSLKKRINKKKSTAKK